MPMTAGSIVLAYNLPDLSAPLKLSRDGYAGIFLGKITKWNDPAIAAANPGVKLPDLEHRRRAPRRQQRHHLRVHAAPERDQRRRGRTGPGTSKSPNWPAGIGGKGNEGVTSTIKQTPGAIGYVEYGYAKQSKMPMAVLENKAGKLRRGRRRPRAGGAGRRELPDEPAAVPARSRRQRRVSDRHLHLAAGLPEVRQARRSPRR